MRVLVVPMSAMAETAGSFSRVLLLTDALKEADIDTAVCLARDVNYRSIDGVKSYFLSVPMPLGLPKMIAAHTFPIAQKLGITSRKSVNSFDDVLHLTGNTDYKYLKKSVSDIRNAIQDFNPDVIYSEFNISAIVAGKIEKKKIFIPASNEPNGHACMPAWRLPRGVFDFLPCCRKSAYHKAFLLNRKSHHKNRQHKYRNNSTQKRTHL